MTADTTGPVWCRDDAPHGEHERRNQFGGTDYCSGRPTPDTLEKRATAYADSLATQDIQAVLQQSVHGASVAGYIAGHRDAVREPEADRLRKMFRLLHGVEPTRAHHPVGAYLPVGQMDGDCSCGRGPWPCDTLRGETRG